MTEASGAGRRWRWDVALSFAGTQRHYVEDVAQVLQARGVRCFYDADEEIELWGKYLAEELPRIYGEQAAAVVVFVSAEYAARDWTRLERQASLARAVRERREYVLPARFDDTPLPGLLPDVSYVDLRAKTPQQFAAMIAAKLAALGLTSASSADASDGPRGAGSVRPAGAVRVSEADPRRLGVHAAISVPGIADEILPEYVPRDADGAESGLRASVESAARRGGFVLLVGGSSVGKTRAAVETVKALLPDWWLVHPAGADQVAALAQAPSPQTVVWLDELQRYLDGEHGLTGAMVRALLNAPHPAVIIGTLWPDRYIAYTTMPAPGGADSHTREREVLDLAAVVRIGPAFSCTEQDRARIAAARDPRLRVALEAQGYGLTQTLAAAPQLVARWQDAQTANPYAWAVLTAALDAARLGARAPLSALFLRAAAPGYCTGQQQAEAPENWFEQALAYATGKLHGAAAALSPVGADMGQVAGYIAADYLVQHASRERRSARVPASTWDAMLSYIRDPADAARLADSADNRLLYRYSILLYRRAADAGDEYGAGRLADVLAERGDPDEAVQILRARVDAGDGYAAVKLADVLAQHGGPDQAIQILRARVDAGNGYAAVKLADLLADRGDLDELRARADAGDSNAAGRLADLLSERGDLDGAIQILRAPTDSGDWFAAWRLAQLLAVAGDLDELRARADAGDGDAAWRLADLLAERGDPDQAVEMLRARSDADDGYTAAALAALQARLLVERGDLDALRARADAGDGNAARRLADVLVERGDLDGAVEILRAQANADTDDVYTAMNLAQLLAERGHLDELRARADAGDGNAAWQLVKLLAERGHLDELRARADAGDSKAASRLAHLLAERLAKRGRSEEAERLHRFGLNPDGSIASE